MDFSESSYRAIEQASFLAQMIQADLTLMHVVSGQLPGKLKVVQGTDRASQALVAQATEDARTLLREAKRKYVPFAINCRSAVRYGDPISQLLAEAEERNSGLIFIPCNLSGLDSPSQKMKLLQDAPIPVLFCKNLGEAKGFRKLLLALPDDQYIREIGSYLHKHFDIIMQKLHVLVPGGEDAAERMAQWGMALQDAGLDEFSSQFVSPDVLVEEWVHAADEEGSQLMILPMADVKDKAANQQLQKLLQKANMPVLVWRAQHSVQTQGA